MQRAFAHSALPNRLFVVADGLDALDYLQDLNLPRMNGFDLLERLQGRPGYKNLPIVILSGSSMEEDVRRARELGADDYRVKTSNLSELKKMLHELRARWRKAAGCKVRGGRSRTKGVPAVSIR